MSSIPLADVDGNDPLPLCRGNREWMIEYFKLPEMILLKYFTDDAPVQAGKATEEQKAAKHIRECPMCRAWIGSIAPASTFQRQSRQTKCCCSGMFSAVEEPDQRGGPRITFAKAGGADPCWQVDGKNSFLKFCPWCGKKLPDKPFVE